MGVLNETRQTFEEAGESLGIAGGTVRRWYDVGCRGHKLEAVRLGRKVFTSKEAVERFLKKLNPDSGEAGAVAG
jgi:excisionase family DNA binding protein